MAEFGDLLFECIRKRTPPRAASGQHQYGRVGPGADLPAQLQAVHVGRADVVFYQQ